jgi:hypothetical protein
LVCDYQREIVKNLAIRARLGLEATQVVMAALDLVAVQAVIDHCQIDSSSAVMHAHLPYEPRAAPLILKVRH